MVKILQKRINTALPDMYMHACERERERNKLTEEGR